MTLTAARRGWEGRGEDAELIELIGCAAGDCGQVGDGGSVCDDVGIQLARTGERADADGDGDGDGDGDVARALIWNISRIREPAKYSGA